MSFFPMLDAKPLPELMALFQSDRVPHGIEPDDAELFLQEVAVRIARSGNDGVAFLLDTLAGADAPATRAIVQSFSFIDRDAANLFLDRIKTEFAALLSSPDPDLIANSIDSINRLGFAEMADAIRPLLSHASPLVVGSVLRFISSHFPSQARSILLDALRSPDPIVRQNAIDELDDLECTEALPSIMSLLSDPDKNVREAAQSAAAHLARAGPREINGRTTT